MENVDVGEEGSYLWEQVPNPIYLHPAIGYCEDTPAARVLEQLPVDVRSSRRW